MYESYWQLEAKPFENSADPRFYYPAASHQAALLKLRYTIENRRGAALLTGTSGLGKTLLARALAHQLPEQISPQLHLVFPQMPADQLLTYLADELTGENSPRAAGIDQSIRRLQNVLLENARADRHALLVIDEAHLLRDTGTLESVRLLLNFEHQGQPAFTLLLVGQPSLLPILERMPELEERLSVKCLLPRLTLDETVAYVDHRLRAAGAERSVFQQDALEAIHQLAQGIPRRINRLCDLALLVGFADEHSELNADHIEAVAEELVPVAA